MSDLNAFRDETRDWLEANCPESMRTPMSQGDVVWGGRKVEYFYSAINCTYKVHF